MVEVHVELGAVMAERHPGGRSPRSGHADVSLGSCECLRSSKDPYAMSGPLPASIRMELNVVQALLDQHTAVSIDGRCPTCCDEDPCAVRRAALRTFARYGCLPRRWPGASRPDWMAMG